VTVDWDVGAAAVATRAGIPRLEQRTARRTVTTGCGQGTVFGDVLADAERLRLPPGGRIGADELLAMIARVRARASVHRRAGSVHGCALFRAGEMLVAVEDVGRHNAIDSIAGWMATRGVAGAGTVFYTTGRLTSEMVLKAAQMGVAIVVSRNGVTAMGHELAQRLGMTLVGRAANRRFTCYAGYERFADAAASAPPVVA
jgi:FdhD protein